MVSVEDLFLARIVLKSDPTLAAELASTLFEIGREQAYSAWANSIGQARPFTVKNSAHVKLLKRFGLCRAGMLRVRINCLNDHVFVTDGVWVDPRWRVFPFSDESEVLVGHAGFHAERADWTLDLATGCGHTALALDGPSRRIGFDINPRALAYALFNRALNGLDGDRRDFMFNDIHDGIHPVVKKALSGRVLVLANMPFGLAPDRDSLPLTSNGGASGASLQHATLTAIQDLVTDVPRLDLRACLLTLSIGDSRAGRWDVVDRARAMFGHDRVEWRLLEDEAIFRIDGSRHVANPSPLRIALPKMTECRLYVADDVRSEQRARYAELARRHEDAGCPDIAYGVIDIDLGAHQGRSAA